MQDVEKNFKLIVSLHDHMSGLGLLLNKISVISCFIPGFIDIRARLGLVFKEIGGIVEHLETRKAKSNGTTGHDLYLELISTPAKVAKLVTFGKEIKSTVKIISTLDTEAPKKSLNLKIEFRRGFK